VPVGPIDVELRLPWHAASVAVRALVAGGEHTGPVAGEVARFPVAAIAEHEVLVITPDRLPDDQGGAR
jgi:hypothetical protein